MRFNVDGVLMSSLFQLLAFLQDFLKFSTSCMHWQAMNSAVGGGGCSKRRLPSTRLQQGTLITNMSRSLCQLLPKSQRITYDSRKLEGDTTTQLHNPYCVVSQKYLKIHSYSRRMIPIDNRTDENLMHFTQQKSIVLGCWGAF